MYSFNRYLQISSQVPGSLLGPDITTVNVLDLGEQWGGRNMQKQKSLLCQMTSWRKHSTGPRIEGDGYGEVGTIAVLHKVVGKVISGKQHWSRAQSLRERKGKTTTDLVLRAGVTVHKANTPKAGVCLLVQQECTGFLWLL